MAPEEALKRAEAKHDTLLGQKAAHLLDRPVAVGAARRQDGLSVSLNAMRLAITAQGLRPCVTLLALTRPPPADTRRAHPETLACRAMGHAAGDRGQNPYPKIKRESC